MFGDVEFLPELDCFWANYSALTRVFTPNGGEL